MTPTKKIIGILFLFLGEICFTADTFGHSQSDQQEEAITFFLLRGIGRESGHWGTTFPSFMKGYFPQAQFVLMDLPGAGRYYDQPALPTVEKMADFLRASHLSALDSLPGKKVIVATSLAGNVALEWITQYPTDFHGAVLLSTSLKGVCNTDERVQPDAKKAFVDIFLTNDIAERETKFLSINSNLNVGNDSLLVAWQGIQALRPVSKGALLKQTVAGMVYQPPTESPQIPLLLVGSKVDKIVSETCFEKVASSLEAKLVLSEDAGHGIPVDVPAWLADTTSQWINQEIWSFEHPTVSATVPTREVDNGLFPVKWLDTSIQVTSKAGKEATEKTTTAFVNSWNWAGDGVDWMGKFTKILKVEDPEQKKEIRKIRKQLKKDVKEG